MIPHLEGAHVTFFLTENFLKEWCPDEYEFVQLVRKRLDELGVWCSDIQILDSSTLDAEIYAPGHGGQFDGIERIRWGLNRCILPFVREQRPEAQIEDF